MQKEAKDGEWAFEVAMDQWRWKEEEENEKEAQEVSEAWHGTYMEKLALQKSQRFAHSSSSRKEEELVLLKDLVRLNRNKANAWKSKRKEGIGFPCGWQYHEYIPHQCHNQNHPNWKMLEGLPKGQRKE